MPVLSVAGVRGLKSRRKLREAGETSSARSSTVLRRLRFTKKGSRSLSAKEQLPFDIS